MDGFCKWLDCDDLNPMVNSAMDERCSNGIDDDCDTFVDCLDSECTVAVDCIQETDCTNLTDDDGDGLDDCEDPDCAPFDCAVLCVCYPSCGAIEVCDDPAGADEDCDGVANCLDDDCCGAPWCHPLSGFCVSSPLPCTPAGLCAEQCSNQWDDDGDGRVDCDDSDCANSPVCLTAVCDGSNFMPNAGFESGPVLWGGGSSAGLPWITSSAPIGAHGGAWLGLLGGGVNDQSELYQELLVPPGASTAAWSWWQRIDTTEPGAGAADVGGAFLVQPGGGAVLATAAILSNLNATGGSWQQVSFDLTPYAGQVVRFQWQLSNDAANPSSLYIDDVSVSCSR
jgi:hypothetical protein